MPQASRKKKPFPRFSVVERFNGYELKDRISGKTHWLSDGIDVLSTANGKPVNPGSEYFRRLWTSAFNRSQGETLEAYFPELLDD